MKLAIILSAVTMAFLAIQIDEVSAICCPWVLNKNVKCECGDGTLVHPWECCSEGACNVFCCNCDKPCRQNKTILAEVAEQITDEVDSMIRWKRDLNQDEEHDDDTEDIEMAAQHFLKIDLNRDLAIDKSEAVKYLGFKLDDKTDLGWFKVMDKNEDGIISPEEFEDGLTKMHIMKKMN